MLTHVLSFFKHYHPFLRLLDPSLSPAKCYDYSVLLFWSIITVASRHYASDPTLITSLAIPVTALLWKNISSPPHTIDLVQAIVLMTTWPFPTSSMHTDPSLTIISIAKATALTLGLHRPETVQDFLRVSTRLNPKEIQEAVKTWAGCYIAAQRFDTLSLVLKYLTLLVSHLQLDTSLFSQSIGPSIEHVKQGTYMNYQRKFDIDS